MHDYLKVIYKLQGDRGAVSTSEIATRLDVSAASVTNMVKRLAKLRLLTYARYHGAALTPMGQRIALEIIRHHRLIELYLAEHLGVSLDKVDSEAEKIEHVLSEDVETRIATQLGNPTVDPHGDPIPSSAGVVRDVRYPTLHGLSSGDTAIVARVSDRNPAVLRRLSQLGVLPGVGLKMLRHRATGCEVELGRHHLILPHALCDSVYIQWQGAESKP
jgi:DtxR family Mn-dependent transcriptional regulator